MQGYKKRLLENIFFGTQKKFDGKQKACDGIQRSFNVIRKAFSGYKTHFSGYRNALINDTEKVYQRHKNAFIGMERAFFRDAESVLSRMQKAFCPGCRRRFVICLDAKKLHLSRCTNLASCKKKVDAKKLVIRENFVGMHKNYLFGIQEIWFLEMHKTFCFRDTEKLVSGKSPHPHPHTQNTHKTHPRSPTHRPHKPQQTLQKTEPQKNQNLPKNNKP